MDSDPGKVIVTFDRGCNTKTKRKDTNVASIQPVQQSIVDIQLHLYNEILRYGIERLWHDLNPSFKLPEKSSMSLLIVEKRRYITHDAFVRQINRFKNAKSAQENMNLGIRGNPLLLLNVLKLLGLTYEDFVLCNVPEPDVFRSINEIDSKLSVLNQKIDSLSQTIVVTSKRKTRYPVSEINNKFIEFIMFLGVFMQQFDSPKENGFRILNTTDLNKDKQNISPEKDRLLFISPGGTAESYHYQIFIAKVSLLHQYKKYFFNDDSISDFYSTVIKKESFDFADHAMCSACLSYFTVLFHKKYIQGFNDNDNDDVRPYDMEDREILSEGETPYNWLRSRINDIEKKLKTQIKIFSTNERICSDEDIKLNERLLFSLWDIFHDLYLYSTIPNTTALCGRLEKKRKLEEILKENIIHGVDIQFVITREIAKKISSLESLCDSYVASLVQRIKK